MKRFDYLKFFASNNNNYRLANNSLIIEQLNPQ